VSHMKIKKRINLLKFFARRSMAKRIAESDGVRRTESGSNGVRFDILNERECRMCAVQYDPAAPASRAVEATPFYCSEMCRIRHRMIKEMLNRPNTAEKLEAKRAAARESGRRRRKRGKNNP